MKKVIVALTATLVVAIGAQSAHAVSCHTFSCVNRQLNSLRREVATDRQALRALYACLNDYAVTQYGNGTSEGYVYDQVGIGSSLTSALDATAPGDLVGTWLVQDSCQTQPTAAPKSSGARLRRVSPLFSPITRPFSLPFGAL